MTKTSSSISSAAKLKLSLPVLMLVFGGCASGVPSRDTTVKISHSASPETLAKYQALGTVECEANTEIQEDAAADQACTQELKDRAENIEADLVVVDKRDHQSCTWTGADCLHMKGRAFKTQKKP